MDGNYEYGSVPYGDSYVITVTIVRVGDIDVIFTSNRRSLLFISENKASLFSSIDPHMTIFKVLAKDFPFVSPKKRNIFITQEKMGRSH